MSGKNEDNNIYIMQKKWYKNAQKTRQNTFSKNGKNIYKSTKRGISKHKAQKEVKIC